MTEPSGRPARPASPARSGCTAAATALAAVLMAPGAAAAPLTFATGPDYPPFTGPDLPDGGLAVALLDAALATQNREVEVVFRPWERGYRQTVNGDVAGTFPYIYNDERAEQVLFSEPLLSFQPKVLSPADDPVGFDGSRESLAGKRLCLPQGYAPEPFIDGMLADDLLEVVAPVEARQCADLVQRDRADFWIQNDLVWPQQVAASPYDRAAFHVAEASLPRTELHVIVGKAHPEADAVIAAINEGLAAIRADGTFDRLLAEHLPAARADREN